MEAQFTDFENAAFAVFIAIVARMISDLGTNFYIPITKVRYSNSMVENNL